MMFVSANGCSVTGRDLSTDGRNATDLEHSHNKKCHFAVHFTSAKIKQFVIVENVIVEKVYKKMDRWM